MYDACRLIRERVPDAASGPREYMCMYIIALSDACGAGEVVVRCKI